VIQIVAKIFQTSLRPSDLICRYGGEEFCMLLTDLSYEKVNEVCERVRKTVEETANKSIRTLKIKPVTISFGVASINSGANSIENLIDYADSALYISKESGRNQVTHWTSAIQKN
jgi:diguanylate cyclase (GGDEF)-like protein